MTSASSPLSATGLSVAIHGAIFAVVIFALAAPPPLDGIGTDVQVALAPDLGEALDSEEDLADLQVPEPEVLEALPEPVIPEARPLEEPLVLDEDLLPEVVELVEPAEVPELSLTVAKVRLPRRRAPTAESPPAEVPPAPTIVRAPAAKPTPPKPRPRPTVRGAAGAGRRGGSTGAARLVPIHRPHHYPAQAQRMGIAGTARVEMLIAPSGQVAGVRLFRSSGHAMLDEAALASARQWRFRPPGEYRRARQSFTYRMR